MVLTNFDKDVILIKPLISVFNNANFSDEVAITFADSLVANITVNETSRAMRLQLVLQNENIPETLFSRLKDELALYLPSISVIRLDLKYPPPTLPDTSNVPKKPILPQSKPPVSNTSYRKIKINKTILQNCQPISDEFSAEQDLCVEGIIFNLERRVLKSGRVLITYNLHGREPANRFNAISVKMFTSEEDTAAFVNLKNNKPISVRGTVKYDDYAKELLLIADTIAPGRDIFVREDNAPQKRVELHLHTNMSALDAVSTASMYVNRAAYWGHSAIAITDHGVVQAFPEAYNVAKKSGIKILYGTEAYLINDATEKKYHHVVILAKNQTGLKNLYKLVSISHLEYFYRRPRITKAVLEEHRDGLLIGSACEAGELFKAIVKNKPAEELEQIASFYDYLEIQPLGNNNFMVRNEVVQSYNDLRDCNRRVIELGEKLNKPVVATCDAHFIDSEDEIFRRIIQAGNDYKDADQQPPLYFRNTEEMLAEFAYLGEEKAFEIVVTNTQAIANSIENLHPIPQEPFPPVVPNAEEDVRNFATEKAHEMYGETLPQIIASRMKQELDSIIPNGFAGMYILAQKLVKESEDNGYLVGSRGSVGSSLVAHMIGITEVNPLPPHYFCPNCGYFSVEKEYSGGSGCDLPDKNCPDCGNILKKDGHDIPFETFLGFDGDKDPDIDLNFSGEYQQQAHAHAEVLLGKGQIFKSGTISTLAEKTAYGYVKKYFESRNETKRRAEIDCLVLGCTGIKKTTGQHPGGLIVVPVGHEIYEFCPIQHPANQAKSGVITTHFDYHSMEGCLLKLDLLGHDVPTILNMLHKFTDIDPRGVALNDPKVLQLFTSEKGLYESYKNDSPVIPTGSLGLPEFGTNFVRQMLMETKPTIFSDLVRISGLSHGTNVWTNNGQDLIKERTATLKEIIPSRDDIMVYLINKGVAKKTAFKIMESVRKGRGVTETETEEMRNASVPAWYINSCRKIEYLFPKAHAVAYVLMTVRIAWFKLYYPAAFYAASFSVKTEDFDYSHMCNGLETAQREYVRLLNTDQKTADSAKTKSTITTLDLVMEMYKRNITFAPLDIYKSESAKFKPLNEREILPPLSTVQGLGQSVAETIVTARTEKPFSTVDNFKVRTKVNKSVLELLRRHGVLNGIPETDQVSLFDM
ncbi:MAG: PolC-type DNA polymerase III [Defluviitaleaceae bacterium]|nr:PolC-type DNA polymerase III [Defluviitaleaceae bacterium]